MVTRLVRSKRHQGCEQHGWEQAEARHLGHDEAGLILGGLAWVSPFALTYGEGQIQTVVSGRLAVSVLPGGTVSTRR
jgi:hypothetical protein